MFEVEVYETSQGNSPLKKYLKKLIQQHKQEQLTKIKAMIDALEKYGFDIGNIFPKSIKLIKDQIYELRPMPGRIFFFYYDKKGSFVLLHAFEKKTQKTPKEEIEKAVNYKNDYLKRRQS